MRIHRVWTLIKLTAFEWNEDRVSRLSASLAFYTVFSIAPVLVIAIAVLGLFFGHDVARRDVTDQLQALMGPAAANATQAVLKNAAAPGSGGVLAAILGIILLLYGATNVFAEMQDSMNTIWEVKPRPGRIWWQILKDRLLSFAMVMSTAFLLVVSLIVSTILAVISRDLTGDSALFWRIISAVASLLIFTLVFAMLFKYVPDVKLRWTDVWIGATFTSCMFTIGKFLIGVYLGKSAAVSVYGTAGSLAVLLIWVYYSAQILYIGAEFTHVYARTRGSGAPPDDNAVPLTPHDRVERGIPHHRQIEQSAESQREEKPREQAERPQEKPPRAQEKPPPPR